MGYTHYYEIRDWDSPEWQAAWTRLVEDMPSIIHSTDIALTGPDPDPDIVTPVLADVRNGISLNGIGRDGHEDFELKKPGHLEFCKTSEKPYDAVVTCVLLRAYMLAPKNVDIESDGCWDEWEPGRSLYERLWPGERLECPWDEDPVPEG